MDRQRRLDLAFESGPGLQDPVARRGDESPEVRAKAINDLQVAISDEAMFLFGIQQINIGVMRKNLEWKEFGNRQDEFNFWGIRPIIT